jgi:protein TonB
MKHEENASQDVGLRAVGTTVVWIGCLAVGLTGLLTPAQPPSPLTKHPPPVQATLIHVDLTKAPVPLRRATPSAMPAPPAPPVASGPPPAPPMTAVAAPSAAIAFALPTTGPTRIVSAAQAIPTGAARDDADVQRMTYGEGEGAQPKPDYPPEAELARQEGVVVVRFTIDQDGHLNAAQVIAPCPYPLLNQSVLRTIREDWQFSPGPVREREISIEFKLK